MQVAVTVRNASDHQPNRYQRGDGVGRPKPTGKITRRVFWCLKKLKQTKAKPVTHTSPLCWTNPWDFGQRNPPEDMGKTTVVLGRRSATESSCQRQGHFDAEEVFNWGRLSEHKSRIKRLWKPLKAFVLFQKSVVPFIFRAVKPTLQKMSWSRSGLKCYLKSILVLLNFCLISVLFRCVQVMFHAFVPQHCVKLPLQKKEAVQRATTFRNEQNIMKLVLKPWKFMSPCPSP